MICCSKRLRTQKSPIKTTAYTTKLIQNVQNTVCRTQYTAIVQSEQNSHIVYTALIVQRHSVQSPRIVGQTPSQRPDSLYITMTYSAELTRRVNSLWGPGGAIVAVPCLRVHTSVIHCGLATFETILTLRIRGVML